MKTRTVSPIVAEMNARAAKAAEFMSTVNGFAPAVALVVMRADAGHKHAEFPQYRGRWDNHKIGRATRKVQTKMGVALEKGDLCMFIEETLEGKPVVSAYSVRNGCDTILNPSYIEAL